MKTLFLAYGNIDRQDDGVAWHVLLNILQSMGVAPLPNVEDEMPIYYRDYVFDFQLQLTPELANNLNLFDKVIFIDAHTGAVPEEIHVEEVTPEFQTSPFTHHMTPATLLSISKVINNRIPKSLLVSVRGYEFGFSRNLSSRTEHLVEEAAKQITHWSEITE